MFELGKTYKTVGGWDAQVIWIHRGDLQEGLFAIHKPHEEGESVPIYHLSDGSAGSSFSVNEPPTYEIKHPADLVKED